MQICTWKNDKHVLSSDGAKEGWVRGVTPVIKKINTINIRKLKFVYESIEAHPYADFPETLCGMSWISTQQYIEWHCITVNKLYFSAYY